MDVLAVGVVGVSVSIAVVVVDGSDEDGVTRSDTDDDDAVFGGVVNVDDDQRCLDDCCDADRAADAIEAIVGLVGDTLGVDLP